ncbi:DUF58 domain-containing protein [Halobacillus sp. BAB-2008]|uniref:DUF58 domain-containing protein n=1 Tax=Halobacillus sp. BAB-2008 TaxID=1246484 RepID=UPI0002A4E747|nr:DUF58 domain-containing protein [Halobacillus sp. BAB-2008]ELK48290.1 hypothetical protein D479_03363 [Halobacillus sp. BAB-2008]
MRQTVSFTVKLAIILLLFGVLFSYAMFQGGFVSWFLFYAFLPFLLYMLGVLLYPINNWKIDRRLSKRTAMGGETVEVEVTMTRRFAYPIYYCVIEEYLPESLKRMDQHLDKFKDLERDEALLEDRKVKRVVFPWFRRKISYRYELDKLPRGEHQWKAVRIKTGDFFGFVTKEHVYREASALLVFPFIRPVKMKERVYSFEQGASPSFKLNEKHTNMVTGVREYMPGDRFAWVDWKTTARKNEMMTKEFEQEKSVDMVLILNTVREEGMNELSFEGAVEFTASLLNTFHKKAAPLAFMTLGGERKYFPFHQDHSHHSQIQAHLAKVRPIESASFAEQLERGQKQVPAGIMMMIISHHLDKDLQVALVKLAKKSKRLLFYYVHPYNRIGLQEHQTLKQLKREGVTVELLTEEQLVKPGFEVST